MVEQKSVKFGSFVFAILTGIMADLGLFRCFRVVLGICRSSIVASWLTNRHFHHTGPWVKDENGRFNRKTRFEV